MIGWIGMAIAISPSRNDMDAITLPSLQTKNVMGTFFQYINRLTYYTECTYTMAMMTGLMRPRTCLEVKTLPNAMFFMYKLD